MCRMDRRHFLQSLVAGAAFVSISDKIEVEYKRDDLKENEVIDMKNEDYVCYCGLYCKLCKYTYKTADILKRDLEHRHGDRYAKEEPEFWKTLSELAVEPKGSCRTGGCNDWFPCAIRKCAKEKGVFACPECELYPCHRIKTLAGGSAFNLVFDGHRMKEIGLKAWLVEQEERIRDGFHYHMLQCVPCLVPTVGGEHDKD